MVRKSQSNIFISTMYCLILQYILIQIKSKCTRLEVLNINPRHRSLRGTQWVSKRTNGISVCVKTVINTLPTLIIIYLFSSVDVSCSISVGYKAYTNELHGWIIRRVLVRNIYYIGVGYTSVSEIYCNLLKMGTIVFLVCVAILL